MSIIRWIIDMMTGRRSNLRYYVGFEHAGNKKVFVLGNVVAAAQEQAENTTVLYVDGATIPVGVPVDEVVLALEESVRQYIG